MNLFRKGIRVYKYGTNKKVKGFFPTLAEAIDCATNLFYQHNKHYEVRKDGTFMYSTFFLVEFAKRNAKIII